MDIILPVLVLGGIGLILGAILAYSSKVFEIEYHVETDRKDCMMLSKHSAIMQK